MDDLIEKLQRRLMDRLEGPVTQKARVLEILDEELTRLEDEGVITGAESKRCWESLYEGIMAAPAEKPN